MTKGILLMKRRGYLPLLMVSIAVGLVLGGTFHCISTKRDAVAAETQDSQNITTQLFIGWNLVAFSSAKPLPIDEALLSISNVCISAWEYDASTSDWHRHILGGPAFLSDLHELNPNHGYWLYVTQDCIWTYPSQQPIPDLVYITKTGTKYHRQGCQYLWGSSGAIERSEAIKLDYTACSVCNP